MPPLPPPKPAPKPPVKPLVFGKPEKVTPWAKYGPWALIAGGLIALGIMIALNPKLKPLNCQNHVVGSASLTAFGTCTTD